MRMHPKPSKRHMQYAEPFSLKPRFDAMIADSFVLTFERLSDGATQSAFLTEDDAMALFESLAAMLHYKDKPASEISIDEYNTFRKSLQRIVS